jgi:hypothetical protein
MLAPHAGWETDDSAAGVHSDLVGMVHLSEDREHDPADEWLTRVAVTVQGADPGPASGRGQRDRRAVPISCTVQRPSENR